jgi:hypothetical protein
MKALSKSVARQAGRTIFSVPVIAALAALSSGAASGQTSNASGVPQDVVWLASPPSNSCTGPTDSSGHVWTDPAFDEAGWISLTPPDDIFRDRFYRGHFQLAAPVAGSSLFASCDDGCEVFVNGTSLGAFGGACHQLGCVNRPGSCGRDQCVPPLLLDQGQLVAGDNVVAVHVSNGGGGGFFSATVLRGDSGACGNCRLDGGEQCDPTVREGACIGVRCGGPGTPNACTCSAELQ